MASGLLSGTPQNRTITEIFHIKAMCGALGLPYGKCIRLVRCLMAIGKVPRYD